MPHGSRSPSCWRATMPWKCQLAFTIVVGPCAACDRSAQARQSTTTTSAQAEVRYDRAAEGPPVVSCDHQARPDPRRRERLHTLYVHDLDPDDQALCVEGPVRVLLACLSWSRRRTSPSDRVSIRSRFTTVPGLHGTRSWPDQTAPAVSMPRCDAKPGQTAGQRHGKMWHAVRPERHGRSPWLRPRGRTARRSARSTTGAPSRSRHSVWKYVTSIGPRRA